LSVEAAGLRFLASTRDPFTLSEPAGKDLLERLFWFRWITGHQISFIIWRLLAAALRRVGDDASEQCELATAITQYVRGYCAMLLYTSSCSRAIYNETVRPSMYRLHTTFSGTWAPDYPAVRSLFHGRKAPPVPSGQVGPLMQQIRLSQRIHLAVADKLVVGGRSLLQRSIADRDKPQPRMWGAIFDCYFLTIRAPVSQLEIAVQLLRRQKAVAIDLATNGLYPGTVPSEEEKPRALLTPDVIECENDIAGIIRRVAGLVSGLSSDGAGIRRGAV
jgi:L-tyrosine peroxygenase